MTEDAQQWEQIRNWKKSVTGQHGLGESFINGILRQAISDKMNEQSIQVHTGDAMDHVTSIIFISEKSDLAGETMPPVIMRKKDHSKQTIHLKSQVVDFLSGLADVENIVESAHNSLVEPYLKSRDIVLDDSKTFEERKKAYSDWQKFRDDYETELNKKIVEYDPDALPDDLETLKLLYIERIESKAMERIRFFKGVLTQQGIDLDPACDDEANAIRKVSTASRLGSQSVSVAQTKEDAGTAYQTTINSIFAVTPLNTPHWTIDTTELDESNPENQHVFGTSVTIRARHPSGATIPGACVISDIPTVTDKITKNPIPFSTTLRKQGPSDFEAVITPLERSIGDVSVIKVTSRNLCGPSKITVEVTAQ